MCKTYSKTVLFHSNVVEVQQKNKYADRPILCKLAQSYYFNKEIFT